MEHQVETLASEGAVRLNRCYSPEVNQTDYETELHTDSGIARTRFNSFDEARAEYLRMLPSGSGRKA